jgi:hypothetical protein
MDEVRVVTNEDIKKYDRLVKMYLSKFVQKNWNEASMSKSARYVALGNTGMTMEDMEQHLRTEVVYALQKYNPNYVTAEGRSVLESTFVYRHLFNRTGQLMKSLTRKKNGYGLWMNDLQMILGETEKEELY